MKLTEKRCIPCEGDTVPLFRPKAEELIAQVPKWTLASDGKSISREVKFKDFAEAMRFADEIAKVAETEGHHPDLAISWGTVGITLSTHSIGGLSENDFILAAKIDELRA